MFQIDSLNCNVCSMTRTITPDEDSPRDSAVPDYLKVMKRTSEGMEIIQINVSLSRFTHSLSHFSLARYPYFVKQASRAHRSRSQPDRIRMNCKTDKECVQHESDKLISITLIPSQTIFNTFKNSITALPLGIHSRQKMTIGSVFQIYKIQHNLQIHCGYSTARQNK